jgi:hypothetical protein
VRWHERALPVPAAALRAAQQWRERTEHVFMASPNPAALPPSKVIVICETGGSMENKPGTSFGFQSRSLKAVYYLQQAGFTRVLHLRVS